MNPAEHRGDPVAARRSRAGRWATAGKRVGYGCFLAAIGAFVVGVIAEFSPAIVTVVVVALACGSLTLAPAIVIGYGVKAAEREDRARPSGGRASR